MDSQAGGRSLIRAGLLAIAGSILASVIWPVAAAASGTGRDDARAAVERENRQKVRRAVGVWRARVSAPLVVSAGVGWVFAEVPVDYPCTAPCEYRGALLQVEGGAAGAQLAAGWAVLIAGGKPQRSFRDAVHVGFGIKGCLLRTWGEPWAFAASETFAGVEASATVSKANVSVGIYRSLAGDPEHRWRLAAGLGYGF